MGDTHDSLEAQIQGLIDREDGWTIAVVLRREHAVALREHIARKLAQERLPVSRDDDVCASVWQVVEERLALRPIDWSARLGIPYLCGIANHKIADLGASLRRIRARDDGEGPLLWEAAPDLSRRRPDRELSGEDRRRALDEVMGRLDGASRELIDLRYVERLMPAAILERAEKDAGLSSTLGLDQAVASIAAAPDAEARRKLRQDLTEHLSVRVYRAKQRMRRLLDEHPLLSHYASATKT
jgi:DNA-directed RNA polymerase specialized sigma24 family protein